MALPIIIGLMVGAGIGAIRAYKEKVTADELENDSNLGSNRRKRRNRRSLRNQTTRRPEGLTPDAVPVVPAPVIPAPVTPAPETHPVPKPEEKEEPPT